MRTILAFALFAATLAAVAGCVQKAAAEELVGTWTLDSNAMKSSPEYQSATPEERKMAEMMFSAMKLDLTFTATEVRMDMEMMGDRKSDSKPYTVKSENGKTLVLSSKNDLGMDEDVTVVVDSQTLTFHSPEGKFTLRRKQ
jgi:hypothetical protein